MTWNYHSPGRLSCCLGMSLCSTPLSSSFVCLTVILRACIALELLENYGALRCRNMPDTAVHSKVSDGMPSPRARGGTALYWPSNSPLIIKKVSFQVELTRDGQFERIALKVRGMPSFWSST